MPDQVVVFQDEEGEWRWHRLAPNGERVATSGESFNQKSNAVRAAEREAEGTDMEIIVNEAAA